MNPSPVPPTVDPHLRMFLLCSLFWRKREKAGQKCKMLKLINFIVLK